MKRKIIVSSGRTMPKKGRDKIAASFTAAIIFLIFLALAPSLGHAMAPSNADVLSSSSTATYVYSHNAGVPFSDSNGLTEFSMPANQTTAYIVYSVTMGEMNDRSAGKVILKTDYTGSANVTLGFGTNESNFEPESYVSVNNASKITIPVSYSMLDGNQAAHLIIKITSKAVSYDISMQIVGNKGYSTFLGPASVAEIMDWIGGILILILAFVGSPLHDINIRVKRGN